MTEELGERVIASLYDENSGNMYHRKGVITERWLDAVIFQVEEYEKESKGC